jgi:hypothetical protein
MASSFQDQVTVALNVLGRLRPLAIVLVGAALVGTLFAGNELRRAVTAYKAAQSAVGPSAAKVKLGKQPLSADDYTRYGGIIAGLVPGVEIRVADDGQTLSIAAPAAASYELWIYALSNLQSVSKNVSWEAQSICLQECARDRAAVAEVRGFVQTAEFE